MRIAFAMINCNRRDGSARAVNEVAERLVDRGHDVHVYARKVEDLDLQKVRWHRVPGPGWPEVMDFYSYQTTANHRLSASRYDIIHSIGCNTQRANVITIQNIQPAKMIILRRLGQQDRVSALRKLTRWLYLKVTCAAERRLYTLEAKRRQLMFLPVSRGVEKELREHHHIGDSIVKIVPNAADTEHFKPLSKERRLAWRMENGIKDDDILLLFAGGEWSRKGLDYAVKALSLIQDPHLKLYVAGDDSDRERFIQMARETGCSNRVIFGGFRRDIATVMGAADLFLFPSWYEAFSLAAIEAAACALPIVATRINGTEDFIQPGVNGEFIEHNSEQIAMVLGQLCSDRDRLRIMGQNGRQIVEQKYTWDRVTDLTEDAYEEIKNSETSIVRTSLCTS